MAQKAKKANVQAARPSVVTKEVAEQPVKIEEKGFSIHYFKVQCIIIAIIGLIFYANSFSNEFALDDRPIIVENEFVKEGFSGIPKILTSDAFASYLQQQNSTNTLNGGRYRPLSIVTFAVEQQFLGTRGKEELADSTGLEKGNMLTEAAENKIKNDMYVRHVLNVLLYIFSVMVLLHFIRTILFPGNTLIPFIAALLFLVHPIHTEVVANVKSRDEILSLLFITLTFLSAFKFYDGRQKKDLYLSLLYFFLALLSKEYALMTLILLPTTLYVLRKQETNVGATFKFILPFLIPFGLYVLMRLSATGLGASSGSGPDDIMNAPYLFATPTEKVASIIATLFEYIRLLFFPHPLSSDYSYNQIPYKELSHPMVWVSLAAYGGLIWWTVRSFKKRDVLYFPLAFFMLHLLMVGNVLINIGAPMGERLVYHSSFGFAIIMGYLLYELSERIKPQVAGYVLIGAVLSIVVALSAFKTIDRNTNWKNDQTLYLHDVNTSPHSVMILGNAGSAYIDLADAEKDTVKQRQLYANGIKYFDKAIALHPAYFTGYLNKGVAMYKMGYPDSALKCWDSVRRLYPNHPTLPYVTRILSNFYYIAGIRNGKAGNHDSAAYYFGKAAHAKPDEGDVWYNLGFAELSGGHYEEAARAFGNCLKVDPNNANARRYYQQAVSHLNQPQPSQQIQSGN